MGSLVSCFHQAQPQSLPACSRLSRHLGLTDYPLSPKVQCLGAFPLAEKAFSYRKE